MHIIIKTLTISVLIAGCTSTPTVEDDHHHNDDIIHVTPAQLAKANIEIGKPIQRQMGRQIHCTGMADVPPESRADIAAPLGGFVRKAPHYEGAQVKKGDVLVALAHPNYIQLQQDYLDVVSQLEYLQRDLERQEQLKEGEAASSKRVQETRSNYTTMKARRDGFHNQLIIAGLNPDHIHKNGIEPMVYLRAPFSGIISRETVSLGKQVGPEDVLYQMYDPTHMHLELQVFPRDLAALDIGQPLQYSIQGSEEWRSGHIVLLGGGVNPATRTIRVHAHPDDDDQRLRPGVFLQAVISVDLEDVTALPESAFEIEEGIHYIFVVHDDGFLRRPIKTGRQSDGFVEILEPLSDEVVVKGAYYLADVDESEHDH